MTAPLPPALAAPPQARPAGDSLLGAGPGRNGQPATAVVVALTRQGALIEGAGKRWLVSGAPPLPHGATLTLELAAAGAAPQPARLLAIGARALAPPLAIRLQPVVAPPGAPPPAESGPRGAGAVPAEARLIGPAGRPLGPAVPITLAAALRDRPDQPGGRVADRPPVGNRARGCPDCSGARGRAADHDRSAAAPDRRRRDVAGGGRGP